MADYSPSVVKGFWVVLALASLFSLISVALGIVAVKLDRERITEVEQGVVTGSLSVKENVKVNKNMLAFTNMQIDRFSTVLGDVTSQSTTLTKELRFPKSVITSPTAAELIDRTSWVQVGFLPGLSSVTLAASIAPTVVTQALMDPFSVSANIGFLQGTRPDLLQLTANDDATAHTAAWLTLEEGTWTILAEVESVFTPAATGNVTYQLVSYNENMQRWVPTKGPESTLITEILRPSGATFISFNAQICMPASNPFVPSVTDRIGLQMSVLTTSGQPLTTWTSPNMTLTAFKTIPST